MLIAGIQKNSFIDFPGNISSVIFTGGCNFNCYYCHNRNIIKANKLKVVYSPELVLAELKLKQKLLDGVVISGGEPCLQSKLIDFMKKVKEETSLKIKLDTNGSDPDSLQQALPYLDFVAMDIKAPKEKYSNITGVGIDIKRIQKSITIIKNSGIKNEFRTTFCPDLTKQDIIDIARWLKGSERYALQVYRKPEFNSYFYDKRLELEPHKLDYIKETFEEIKPYFETCLLHGV